MKKRKFMCFCTSCVPKATCEHSGLRVVWYTLGCWCLKADEKLQRFQSFEQPLEFFRLGAIQMIFCRNWWPWAKPGNVTMTRRQSNSQLSGGIAVHPARPKIRWKSFRLDFLGSRRHPPHWLSSKGPNYQLGVYPTLLVKLKDILKKKRRGKVTNGVLFMHDSAPAYRALATQKKLAYLGFHCLDHPPYYLDLAPSDYHLYSGLKNNWKVAIFLSTRKSLLPRRPGWTDNVLNFFEWLAKVRATG